MFPTGDDEANVAIQGHYINYKYVLLPMLGLSHCKVRLQALCYRTMPVRVGQWIGLCLLDMEVVSADYLVFVPQEDVREPICSSLTVESPSHICREDPLLPS